MALAGMIRKLLAIVYFVQACSAFRKWDDLRVKHDSVHDRGYYMLPTSTYHLLIGDYVQVAPEEDFKFPLDFYCFPDDPRACLMFDKKGNVAGFQTSFLKADFANVDLKDYDYSSIKDYKKTKFFNIDAYSVRVYFTNPEQLTEDGRKDKNEMVEGLWVYLDGRLVEIPRAQPTLSSFGDFYRQGCMRSMGVHYFYKIDKNLTDCKQNFPLFALYEEGSLVGYGISAFGNGTAGPSRDWYERTSTSTFNAITPNRAPCLKDLVKKYGVTTMHVYLVERPWNISCTLFDRFISRILDWLSYFALQF